MNFDARDYLRIAEQLSGRVPDNLPCEEAKLRSAISRAYYAALLTAVKYIKIVTPDVIIPKHDSHTFVLRQLEQLGGKLTFIATNLNAMRYKRNNADYDFAIRNIPVETSSVILQSTSAINTISDLILKQSSVKK